MVMGGVQPIRSFTSCSTATPIRLAINRHDPPFSSGAQQMGHLAHPGRCPDLGCQDVGIGSISRLMRPGIPGQQASQFPQGWNRAAPEPHPEWSGRPARGPRRTTIARACDVPGRGWRWSRMRSQCRRVTMLIQRRPGAVTGIVCQRAPSRMSHRAPNRPCGFSASSRACSTTIRRRASSARAVCPAALPRMPKVRQDEPGRESSQHQNGALTFRPRATLPRWPRA